MGKNRSKYSHIDWQALRELIAKGATFHQLAETFNIPFNTIQARSYRERWNVPAIRAQLPKRSKTERKDSERDPHRHNTLRTGVLLPLVKLASYYQACDLQTLRKEQTQFLAFAHTALKVLTANDPRSAGGTNPVINLTLLQTRPEELALRAVREIQTTKLESKSSESPSESDVIRPESANIPSTSPEGEARS